ncbi:uncharacterized protein LOC132544824 isoform X2 [Ylistrum balloti]|uniref:uncharacterized protein LOC132544824 isoform X2 n=1 Tax=Ylistrum balloti TaxID=509963 RepID=UPI002905E04A|nr:uncharacterized protein LOC132544824 isoform X2 [Ylistrum balloti]
MSGRIINWREKATYRVYSYVVDIDRWRVHNKHSNSVTEKIKKKRQNLAPFQGHLSFYHSTGEDIDESDAAVLERFPGYFRTEEEQRKLERGLRRHIPVNETLDVANCNFSVVNTNDFPWCNLVPSPDEYHSCCVSNIQYVSPVYKTDTNGINRKLAVFDNQRQYFRSETCTQLGGCMMCTCLKEEVLYTGVYDTGKIGQSSRYGVAWFNFDGCCKCYNNVP